jgi:hypothetical protein
VTARKVKVPVFRGPIDPVHASQYSLILTAGDVQDLASGIINNSVRSMALWLLEDLDARLRRNAERPVRLDRGRRSADTGPR